MISAEKNAPKQAAHHENAEDPPELPGGVLAAQGALGCNVYPQAARVGGGGLSLPQNFMAPHLVNGLVRLGTKSQKIQ